MNRRFASRCMRRADSDFDSTSPSAMLAAKPWPPPFAISHAAWTLDTPAGACRRHTEHRRPPISARRAQQISRCHISSSLLPSAMTTTAISPFRAEEASFNAGGGRAHSSLIVLGAPCARCAHELCDLPAGGRLLRRINLSAVSKYCINFEALIRQAYRASGYKRPPK